MEGDAEKLIELVKNRPALYNFKLKEHSDKNLIDCIWADIALVMKCSVHECKHRWMTLRNSYARALRAEGGPSEIVPRKKKPWYMRDAMSFLKVHMRHKPRSLQRSLSSETQNSKEINHSTNFQNYTSSIDKCSVPSPTSDMKTENSVKQKSVKLAAIAKKFKRPTLKLLLSEMIEEADDPNFMFLQSLLSDINKLPENKQRIFKRKAIEFLEELFDDKN